MRRIIFFSVLSVGLTVFLLSCKKKHTDSPEPPASSLQATASVLLNFTNVADSLLLRVSADEAYTIGTPKYVNAFGDTFSVASFKYFVTNIKLKRDDGSYYIENNSYHLLDASDTTTCKFNLKNVPLANYVSLEFMLGVDSVKNTSGAQSGALDPSSGMYWAWNSGYIFMRFFGYSNSAPANTSHNITYEIGGVSNYRLINLPLQSNLAVDNNHASKIYLKTNVLECFKSPNTISFAFLNEAMTPKNAQPLVENYGDIFTIAAIK